MNVHIWRAKDTILFSMTTSRGILSPASRRYPLFSACPPEEFRMSDAQPLPNVVVDDALLTLQGWKREEGGLRKRFRRANFMDAIAFVNRIAELAEAAQHHPDIDIRWRNIIVFLTTHEAGGVTELDLALARQIEAAAHDAAGG
jgi:4a-hydroxytetrahydrobiopterin dehydratase